jgi:putative ABC transport system permease protein
VVRILLAKLGRDLRRQAPQFVAVTVIAMLGVALYGAANDAYLNLKASYASMFSRLHFADLQVTGGDKVAFEAGAAQDPAVADIQARQVADVPFQVGGQHRLIGRLVGLPAGQQPSVDQVLVLKGSYLTASDPRGVLVEQHFADHFHLQPGSRLQVRDAGGWVEVSVLGVVASAEYLWPARSRQDALASPDDFGVLFAPDQFVSRVGGPEAQAQVLVYLRPGARGGPSLGHLESTAAQLGATDVTDRANQPSNAALSEDIDGFGELAVLFPILFLGAAAMTIYVLLTRLVHSQRAVIGTLLACGVRPRQLLLHYLGFGAVVGLVGGVLGAALGVLLGGWLTGAYTSALEIPIAVIGAYPATAATGVVIASVVGLLAALAPALAAFRVPPAEAMRGIAPIGLGGKTLLERALPGVGRLPASVLMVLRSVWRSRRRAITTVIGVILASTVILVSWGMLDSTQLVLQHQFQDVQRQDAIAYTERPVGAELLSEVANAGGVARVEEFAQLPVTLRHGGHSYPTAIEGFQPNTQMHGFYGTDGRPQRLPAAGVLLGAALGEKLSVQRGDAIELQLTSLGRSVAEPVRGFVNEAVGSFAYVSIGDLAAVLDGVDPANAILLRYTAGSTRDSVDAAISHLPGVAVVVDSRATANAFSGQYLQLFDAIVGAMLVFGVALAFGLIFATISVNVLERTQEFATLLTSGVRTGQLAAMVSAENMALTMTGLVLGLAAGYWATGAFLSTLNSDLFHFDEYVLPRSYLITAAAILVAALASELPGLRTISRLDLAAAARERAA